VTSLHGNRSQNQRQEALDGFRKGAYQVLVATDIAARGIDVSSISHVINYDMPDTADAYTHRIGRTGRAAKTGDAFTFITREDNEMVRAIERVLGEKVDRRIVEGFDYKKPSPSRDTEFARPPREPQRRRVSTAAQNQKTTHTGRTETRKPVTAEVKKTVQRNFASRRFTWSTANNSRTHNPVA
jgi:superfamily II DNA/RNA helicase